MPTSDDVLTAVRPLLPTLEEAAAGVDRAGAVAAQSIDALRDTGVFAMLQPAAFGGLQAHPDDYLAVVRDVSAACSSTGWLTAMFAVNAWHLALFDRRAQHDVWGTDPRALLSASYAPTGRLERTRDGYRLSGRWSRCTGVDHAAWSIVGALIVDDGGAAEDFTVTLIPRSDYTVEKSWNGLGLRGIGAHDILAAGAFVPEYRTFGWVSGQQRGTLDQLYRLPQPTLYTHSGTAPAMGAAETVLAAHQPTAPLSEFAMAQADLELSALQMQRNLAALMDCARTDSDPGAELMLRTRRDQVMAFARAMAAVRLVVERHEDTEGRVERVWRDLQTAHLHVANDVDRVLTSVGQFELGLQVDEFML